MNACQPPDPCYNSEAMLELFSEETKFRIWRKLWVVLAETEAELGLPISQAQIDELKTHEDDLNLDVARAKKKELDDVTAHVRAYGEQCPLARDIIHLGATSMYVCDNTDILLMHRGLVLIQTALVGILDTLSRFAAEHKALPTLAYTQSASPTTVGKRATLWMYDLLLDLREIEHRLETLRPLGCKGDAGTQANFLALFAGDFEKVRLLDSLVAQKMGFESAAPVSGQTYSRKMDDMVLHTLSGIAQSAAKFAGDIRLLQHMKEIEEPLETRWADLSDIACMHSPMRTEHMCSLARYVMVNALNPVFTAAHQWFERTRDDSANRRICVPEAFLCVDAILTLYRDVAQSLVVHPNVIARNLEQELPLIAMESILTRAEKHGGDREALRERIRIHAMEAVSRVKEGDGKNDMLERIVKDNAFRMNWVDIKKLIRAEDYTGCAETQTERFLSEEVLPVLARYQYVVAE